VPVTERPGVWLCGVVCWGWCGVVGRRARSRFCALVLGGGSLGWVAIGWAGLAGSGFAAATVRPADGCQVPCRGGAGFARPRMCTGTYARALTAGSGPPPTACLAALFLVLAGEAAAVRRPARGRFPGGRAVLSSSGRRPALPGWASAFPGFLGARQPLAGRGGSRAGL